MAQQRQQSLQKPRDAVFGDGVAQEGHRGESELAFLTVDGEASRSQTTKHRPEMVQMEVRGRACNKDTIQVDEAELQTPEDTVHQMLEGLGGVLQPKRHAKELKQAEWGYDGRFLDVYVSHRDLVVTPDQVHHGEDDRAGHG